MRGIFIRYAAVAASLSWTTGAINITVGGVKTGINPTTNQRPARRNINELSAEGGPEWDLYILALSAFQAVDETDDLSYFQIAGIHGLPFSAWNNVESVPGAPEESGYCPHGELLFSTWHRPYLALFEQVLVSHAVNISHEYPQDVAPAYLGAALTLRLPYWDWAFDPRVPEIMSNVTVTVNGPAGPTTTRNPLYSYRFQGSIQETWDDVVYSGYNETIRCLGDDGQVNNITASNLKMDSQGPGLKLMVWDVFINSTRFEDMAFYGSRSSGFEGPHNNVHSFAGCDGTISAIHWSAFDPLFMLHHCNIDRLFAMWQAIYYDNKMFNSTSVTNGQYAIPQGATITRDSPLKPFRSDPLTFFTSETVTNISTFGYTYPEIEDWAKTPAELRTSVISHVNMLYNPANTYNRPKPTPPPPHWQMDFSNAPPLSSFPTMESYYVAKIQVDRSEIPLPATVDLVLDGTTVGTLALLSMPLDGVVSARVPILDPRRLVRLSSPSVAMDEEMAGSILQHGLAVEIRHANNNLVPLDTVPSLVVEVHVAAYTPNSNEFELPRLGSVKRLPVAIQKHFRR